MLETQLRSVKHKGLMDYCDKDNKMGKPEIKRRSFELADS